MDGSLRGLQKCWIIVLLSLALRNLYFGYDDHDERYNTNNEYKEHDKYLVLFTSSNFLSTQQT